MSGPRHKATVAKDMAISLVRPLLYFVLRELLQSIQKLENKFKNTISNYFPQSLFMHVYTCSCIEGKKKMEACMHLGNLI